MSETIIIGLPGVDLLCKISISASDHVFPRNHSLGDNAAKRDGGAHQKPTVVQLELRAGSSCCLSLPPSFHRYTKPSSSTCLLPCPAQELHRAWYVCLGPSATGSGAKTRCTVLLQA